MIENYEILKTGVIHQKKIFNQIKKYDSEYVEIYNTYGIGGHQMSGIRMGYLISSIGKIPNSILDVGYGNGDFLLLCSGNIENCYGNDISNYPLPKGVKFVEDITDNFYEVICFFDVLEHFENIDFVKDLKCEYVFLSVPWCHYIDDEWFFNWKHRKPDEHLWHFNEKSIVTFFKENGFDLVNYSNVEDVIRKSVDGSKNILTCVFKKNS